MTADVRLIATREIRERIRDRGFLIWTILMLVLLPGGVVGSAIVNGDDTRGYSVATVGQGSAQLARVLEQRVSATGGRLDVRRVPDRQAGREAVRDGDVDAALVGDSHVLIESKLQGGLGALLQSSAAQLRTAQALRAAGATGEQMQSALDPAPLRTTNVGNPEQNTRNMVVAMAGSIVLFLALYLYGYFIAAGVVEEKSSRVIEVVLAAVRPTKLLAGKVLGIGVLALAQLVLTVGLAIGAAVVAGLPLPPVTFSAAGSVLVWFVAGFAFYSCVFAVAGSLVSKQEDLQYTQMPPMVLILGGYLAGIQYLTGALDPTIAHVLAYLPPFAPMLMPVLSAGGDVAVWEPLVAALLTIIAAAGLINVAARIYNGSLLRFGGRVKLREAWR